MNGATVGKLVRKDWSLNRITIIAAFAAGLASLALTVAGGEGLFYMGNVLLITVVIGFGIFLAISTVVEERTEHTLQFVMSLPVSLAEYTAAKLLGNLTMFTVPWLALGITAIAMILSYSAIPDGLLPYAVLVLVQLLLGFVLALGIALVAESLGWAIGAMVSANLLFHALMYYAANRPDIAATMSTESIVWSTSAVTILAAQISAAILILFVTWRLRLRKTDSL